MTYGRRFWIAVAVGWAVIAFGVVGLFANARQTHPDQWVRWFVGAALAHDLLLAPVVFSVGRYAARWGTSVKGGLIASGVLLLIAYPMVRGFGRDPANPSILPLNYWLNLVLMLAGVWLVVGLSATVMRRRTRGPSLPNRIDPSSPSA